MVRNALPTNQPIECLSTTLGAGQIRIEAGGVDAVEVEAEVLVRRKSAAAAVGDLQFEDHVQLVQNGDQVEVTSVHDEDADSDDWQLRLTIRVPDGVTLRSILGVGSLSIEVESAREIVGAVGVGDAEIVVDTVQEHVDLDVGVGQASVTIRQTAPARGMRLQCKTGSLSAYLPESVNGTFELTAGVGDVQPAARFGLDKHRQTTSAKATGRIGESTARYELTTSVGNVTLE